MRRRRSRFTGFLPLLLLLAAVPVGGASVAAPPDRAPPDRAPLDRRAVAALVCGSSSDALTALRTMTAAASGGSAADAAWSLALATGFSERRVRCGGDGRVVLGEPPRDAVTGAPATIPDDARAPLPSLRARALLADAEATLTLFAPTPRGARLAAIDTLSAHADRIGDATVAAALARARDPAVRLALRRLAVETGLHATDRARRLAAIRALGRSGTDGDLATLRRLEADPVYDADPLVAAALGRARAHGALLNRLGAALSLGFNGLSAGSVLFLSAVGLAIVFGLMGVINLAQGELIAVGAYTTFCVQQVLAEAAPGLLPLYPLIAVPFAFLVTALVGIAIEVTVIRHLYRRPLMTLLATWGISLLLSNLLRVLFGTGNVRFDTPGWLVGGVAVLGDFVLTWNHLFAIVFALAGFAGVTAVLRSTDLGLFMRAVTANRAMAGALGVPTRRIDMLAFGIGAGLAGLAGLALSPTYNVNPTMGSGFIIDSFMVVVLGGVGSLAGTAIASLGIGLVDVGIEPFYGAVAAKVVSLLIVILLIQWRPEGLIAAKGRL